MQIVLKNATFLLLDNACEYKNIDDCVASSIYSM